jgi:lycopene beta-cyclase
VDLDRFQYLAVMALCVLVTLPLELVLDARVYRRPRRMLGALVPTAAAFVAWDLLAIHLGHWTFSPRYTTGVRFWTVPLEEVVFFVVIPLCALLSFEAVSNVLRDGWSTTLRRSPAGRVVRRTGEHDRGDDRLRESV